MFPVSNAGGANGSIFHTWNVFCNQCRLQCCFWPPAYHHVPTPRHIDILMIITRANSLMWCLSYQPKLLQRWFPEIYFSYLWTDIVIPLPEISGKGRHFQGIACKKDSFVSASLKFISVIRWWGCRATRVGQVGVSQTCLGANVPSGLVPSTFFFKEICLGILGALCMGKGAPLLRYLCTTWESLHMFFTKMCPSGGTKQVSLQYFGNFRGLGRGAPGTVPLQNPQVTSQKAWTYPSHL